MDEGAEKLDRLRPVTFKLKNDPERVLQYGLVAEEVAKVYPELVIHGVDGQINGVRYEELAPMLLNVVQKQQKQIARQGEEVAAQRQLIADQTRRLQAVEGMLTRMRAH